MNRLIEKRNAALQYDKAFYRIFHEHVTKFWENMIGSFDIVRFDDWLNTPDDISTSDYLEEKFGGEAKALIEKLLSI